MWPRDGWTRRAVGECGIYVLFIVYVIGGMMRHSGGEERQMTHDRWGRPRDETAGCVRELLVVSAMPAKCHGGSGGT